MNNYPWLTTVLFLPLAASVVLQLIPARARGLLKGWTVLATLATAIIVAGLIWNLASTPPSHAGGPLPLRFEETVKWIPNINSSYHLGLDGISAWVLALNAGVFLLGSLVVSKRDIERIKLFCGLLLFTETATAGVILSVDLLLFYVFWEAMLIPLYFLLSGFGGERRGPATLKFVIYTVAGSLFMLLGIIYLGLLQGNSFDLEVLLQHPLGSGTPATFLGITLLSAQQFAFLGFALAFAIKMPLVPFHTWLPDLYESAPPAALTFFAGIVSKLGAFAFIRFALTLFPGPTHDFQWLLLALSVLSIIYGALLALAETDIKRIVAYSSISHIGFIGLGIFALNSAGLDGAIMQIVNHGIIIAALFLIVGMVESRTGTRDRTQLAGLEARMPYLYFFFLVITLAGLGMPGMNSFAGEFTILLGAFQNSWVWAVLASAGVLLACWYMLRLHQGLMHEPPQQRTESVRDLRLSETLVLIPLAALTIILGVWPKPVADLAASSASHYVAAGPQEQH